MKIVHKSGSISESLDYSHPVVISNKSVPIIKGQRYEIGMGALKGSPSSDWTDLDSSLKTSMEIFISGSSVDKSFGETPGGEFDNPEGFKIGEYTIDDPLYDKEWENQNIEFQIPEEDFPKVVGRISFFVNAGIRFVEELCKMRAFTEMWDEICQKRYNVEDPKFRRFRYPAYRKNRY